MELIQSVFSTSPRIKIKLITYPASHVSLPVPEEVNTWLKRRWNFALLVMGEAAGFSTFLDLKLKLGTLTRKVKFQLWQSGKVGEESLAVDLLFRLHDWSVSLRGRVSVLVTVIIKYYIHWDFIRELQKTTKKTKKSHTLAVEVENKPMPLVSNQTEYKVRCYLRSDVLVYNEV